MMKELFKTQYKRLLLALVYTLVGACVYAVIADALWHLLYVDMIVAAIIFIIGCVIGYFYAKAGIKKEEPNESVQNSMPQEQTEEKPLENQE